MFTTANLCASYFVVMECEPTCVINKFSPGRRIFLAGFNKHPSYFSVFISYVS
jgi:hypothetical protein